MYFHGEIGVSFELILHVDSALSKCYFVVRVKCYMAKQSHQDAFDEDVCGMWMLPNTSIHRQCTQDIHVHTINT